MNPRTLHGRTLALVTVIGLSTIRWRVYGFSGREFLVRSVDGKRESRISQQELESLLQSHRLVICLEGD